MIKLLKCVYSFLVSFIYKIIYRKKLTISYYNSFSGKLSISILNRSRITIGKKIMIRGPVYINAINGGIIDIGKNVFFNRNCSVTSMGKIIIGDFCMFGNNVVVVDHDHNFTNGNLNEYIKSEIKIGNNVWIGANSTILRGVTIGDNSIIGANSLVNKDVPAGEVWAGVPAKKIR